MAHYIYKAGLGNASAFEVSGIPYVQGAIDAKSTVVQLDFPRVTRWIVVTNDSTTDDPLRVGFSQNGVTGSNFFPVLPGTTSPRLEVKVTELYLSGSDNVSVIAGLTTIEIDNINTQNVSPSGSNWSGSLNAHVG